MTLKSVRTKHNRTHPVETFLMLSLQCTSAGLSPLGTPGRYSRSGLFVRPRFLNLLNGTKQEGLHSLGLTGGSPQTLVTGIFLTEE
ncbi:hypothetical protein E2C01_051339 [Portunus trituberculatus]|uniref:Uncharacterized protein n=1 Tax=Portunus trituberculatus TaxID=210409 RepID=A0A5B7GAQ1_PORTR|nr:hypothetical protein [Portunus trituberculatus]